jgi:hypothetical protein
MKLKEPHTNHSKSKMPNPFWHDWMESFFGADWASRLTNQTIHSVTEIHGYLEKKEVLV